MIEIQTGQSNKKDEEFDEEDSVSVIEIQTGQSNFLFFMVILVSYSFSDRNPNWPIQLLLIIVLAVLLVSVIEIQTGQSNKEQIEEKKLEYVSVIEIQTGQSNWVCNS